jgi:hypothetical protein
MVPTKIFICIAPEVKTAGINVLKKTITYLVIFGFENFIHPKLFCTKYITHKHSNTPANNIPQDKK